MLCLARGLARPVFGQGRILHARQESLDLEKKELNLVVLAILRVSRSLPNDFLSQVKLCKLLSSTIRNITWYKIHNKVQVTVHGTSMDSRVEYTSYRTG